MSIDPANAEELAAMASEIGADVLQGVLSYPSETAGWQLGDLDLSEHLTRFRDRRVDGPHPAPARDAAPASRAKPQQVSLGLEVEGEQMGLGLR